MLPQRLKELRVEREKTQQDIADVLGITRPAYTAYESGNRQPDYETLNKLAELYNSTTDYLLGRSDIRRPQSQVAETPTDQELEELLHNSNVKFDGAPLDKEDKQDIINFLRMIWNRKKDK